MDDTLTQPIEYQITETGGGTWRRYSYPDGKRYAEYSSNRTLFGLPLLHYTQGISPETNRRVTARGFFAVGRFARGVVAIGQVAYGVIAIGQLSIGIIAIGHLALGVLFGLGQASTGFVALGQLAFAGLFAIGQASGGYVAVGQIGVGEYVLAQFGLGKHVWDMRGAAPEAVQFFGPWLPW
jgi:hypothetical protein